MTLAGRAFDANDQQRFASASGDFNPMHLDAVAARRTQAGAPVVHGVHLLLWALDTLAAAGGLAPLSGLHAQFDRFVYVDEAVEVALVERDGSGARLALSAGGAVIARIDLTFGGPRSAGSETFAADAAPIPLSATPRAPAFEAMAALSGRLVLGQPETLSAMFPALARWLGPSRLAALAACTRLVGMICPGLHSILSEMKMDAIADFDPLDALAFKVTRTDRRFRLVRLAVRGGGFEGVIGSLARMPPTQQPSLQSLAGLIAPDEFAGSTALIIGGSRGLGELAAKLVCAGGGRSIVTYRVGREDAEAVAGEIRSAGGDCQVMAYDTHTPAERQLGDLTEALTHAYYFATPAIFRPRSDLFDQIRFDEFRRVYVDGFWTLSQALHARRSDVSLFYPSSLAVVERPRGMTEYAMAKAAGEVLCADMNNALAPLHVTVSRLPRLLTDQTASPTQSQAASAAEILAPLVREVQSWPRNG